MRRLLGEQFDGSFDGALQVHVQFLEVELAGFDLGEIQDVVDDGKQRVAAGTDRLDVFLLVLVERGVEQQARHADNAVHGRADFVAHVGQELALELGAGERLVARLGQFALDALAFDDLLVQDAVGLGELGGALLDAGFEFLVGAAHHALGLLALGDVARRADPLADAPVVFQHRHAAHREGAVGAVHHAQAQFVLVDGAGLQRPAPEVARVFAVVGVDGLHPAVAGALLEALAGGVAPLGQVGGHAALGVEQPDDLGAGGDERAVTLLAALGGLAGALLVVDVRAGAEPLDDAAVGVAHGHGAAQVPAVHAVAPAADAHLGVERLAGFHRAAHAFVRARLVVGMHGGQPAVLLEFLDGQAGVLVEAAVEVVDGAVGLGGPDDLGHAVGHEPVAADRAREFVLGALAQVHLPLERAAGGGDLGVLGAQVGFEFGLLPAQADLHALVLVDLAAQVAALGGDLAGALADLALHAGARVLEFGVGAGGGAQVVVALAAGVDEEHVLEERPGGVFDPAPVGAEVGQVAEDGLRPVVAAQALVERHDARGGQQHAPVAVERQERQRAEDVVMRLAVPAGQVDEQRGGEHLADGDRVAGGDRAGAAVDQVEGQRNDGPAQAHGRRHLDAHVAGAGDPGVRRVPDRDGDGREPLEAEQPGEEPVDPFGQGGALASVKLLAAMLDKNGVGFHETSGPGGRIG